jgi:hypothetical protein
MNSQSLTQLVTIGPQERAAVRKRLTQIAVALGHPRMAAVHSAILVRERASLEQILATASVDVDLSRIPLTGEATNRSN